MKWSWRLGEFRGIAVTMHATFLILIAMKYAESTLAQWH
jgi:hypothetical protein